MIRARTNLPESRVLCSRYFGFAKPRGGGGLGGRKPPFPFPSSFFQPNALRPPARTFYSPQSSSTFKIKITDVLRTLNVRPPPN